MARELPTGTVTFLFTDVEGSTKLLDELGAERYAEELGRHREIVRGELVEHGGVEVDTQGDAFFCAFASARSALSCAAAIQNALEAGPIRLRMGVHTGEALLADGHYVGLEVHRAARIGACGHGGQVVVSGATAALLDPEAIGLRNLGAHRLKDLSAPVVLLQLGNGDFPPLKTLFRTNLPVPATPFLGREQELRELVERASAPGVRALTLTGPGGTGKTRLSLQLAAELSEDFRDGAWWVPLASLDDGSLVASAVANVLQVEEEPGRSLTSSIASALATKRLLLVLDNCEHLVDAAGELVAAVLGEALEVLVLATSREPLAVAAEEVVPVEPLVSGDAVELFRTRARSAGARLDGDGASDVVAALCARLDNLPLAVELAAARAAVIAPSALLDRLSSGLDVLKGPRDVEDRQRTLRATIAWSHGLLGESEQALFRRLAVFSGGGELSAIEEVCEADLDDLLSLVAKSLVRQAPVDGAEARYWMLETIREFAADELERSADACELRERHAEWFVELARRAGPELEGPDSGEWLAVLERDLDNLRTAFVWLERERADSSAAVDLAGTLAARHSSRGRYAEAEDVVRRAVAFAPEPLGLATLQDRLARLLRLQGHPRAALEAYESAEGTLEGVADRDGTWWRQWLDLELAKATFYYFENAQPEMAALVRVLEPLVTEQGTPLQRLELLHLRTQQAYREERYAPSERTEELARETYRRAVELGDVGADFMLGFCLLWRGRLEEAEEHFVLGRETARTRGIAIIDTRCLVYGTIARRRRNDVEGVRAWLTELESQDEHHGYKGLTAANASWLAFRDGDLDRALGRGGDALAEWHTEGLRGSRVFEWTARFPLLGVAVARDEIEAAREHARAMLDPDQQPLLPEIDVVLRAAVHGDGAELVRALEVAASLGYA